jgi:hypothetical protein
MLILKCFIKTCNCNTGTFQKRISGVEDFHDAVGCAATLQSYTTEKALQHIIT